MTDEKILIKLQEEQIENYKQLVKKFEKRTELLESENKRLNAEVGLLDTSLKIAERIIEIQNGDNK